MTILLQSFYIYSLQNCKRNWYYVFLQDLILKKVLSCEYKTEDVVDRACGFYS